MKILIVDDERLVRVTLQSMLEELYEEQDEIYEAGSAAEMEKVLKSEAIDLVFLDINMPKTTGLLAMEELAGSLPHVSWCILTGYTYFEYAKKALNLGASGYLVKPPDPEELKAFVDQTRTEREEALKKEQQLFAAALRNLLDTGELKEGYENKEFQLIVFFVDTNKEEERRAVYHELYKKLEAYFMGRLRTAATMYGQFFTPTGELCMIMTKEQVFHSHTFLKRHFKKAKMKAVITGCSRPVERLCQLAKALKYTLALSSMRFYQPDLTIRELKSIEADGEVIRKQYFAEVLERLTAKYLVEDREGFLHELNGLTAEWIRENKHFLTKEVLLHLQAIWNAPFQAPDLEALLAELKAVFLGRIFQAGAKGDTMEEIRAYVKEHYMEDVSIAKIGEIFQITPTYLSRIFHEKTKQKYIDYVTEIRMEKAKLLIRRGDKSIKKVSELVGYSSEKHFSKTFKRYTGVSPSNYPPADQKQQ